MAIIAVFILDNVAVIDPAQINIAKRFITFDVYMTITAH